MATARFSSGWRDDGVGKCPADNGLSTIASRSCSPSPAYSKLSITVVLRLAPDRSSIHRRACTAPPAQSADADNNQKCPGRFHETLQLRSGVGFVLGGPEHAAVIRYASTADPLKGPRALIRTSVFRLKFLEICHHRLKGNHGNSARLLGPHRR